MLNSQPDPRRRYVYLGDRFTREDLRGAGCVALVRPDGRCICGRNATMLVLFDNGETSVVLRRRLSRVEK